MIYPTYYGVFSALYWTFELNMKIINIVISGLLYMRMFDVFDYTDHQCPISSLTEKHDKGTRCANIWNMMGIFAGYLKYKNIFISPTHFVLRWAAQELPKSLRPWVRSKLS